MERHRQPSPLNWFKGATPAIEATPALLGVGYIIGTRISCIMVAGGILAWFVLCPAIMFFGEGFTSSRSISGHNAHPHMDADAIRAYIFYIGAGAVAAGGIISLCRALPLIVASIRAGLRDMNSAVRAPAGNYPPHRSRSVHADRAVGLFFWCWPSGSSLALIRRPAAASRWPRCSTGSISVAAVLIVLFGFLFVTVSSRLTGEIGSSSNPISGMTVATLLLTCLIFLRVGLDRPQYRLIALSVAAVVCIASSNGGTTSQDLKTGFLVGATPKWQQLSILVGSVSSALVIGVILLALNQAGTVYSSKNLPQPNSRWMLKASTTAAGTGTRWKNLLRLARTEGNPRASRRENTSSTSRDKSAGWSIRASAASSPAATTARRSRKFNPPRPNCSP